MSIASQAAAEYRANLEADGDTVIMIDPNGVRISTSGWVRRTESRVDPMTGEAIYEARTSVNVAAGPLPSDVTEEWRVETVDGRNQAVTGRIVNPRYDHTLSFVTFDVEVGS